MKGRDEKKEPTQPETSTVEEEAKAAEKAVEGDILGLYEQIEKLTTERDQLQHQVLRTMADFQNFRKRNQAEVQQLRQFATEALVRDLLPVIDNFERTLAHHQNGASVESLVEGVRAVERQLRTALEGQNVRRIESVGQPFDPEKHEAIGTEATNDYPEDTVVLEVESGYTMADRVIRPSRVKVAKGA